MSGIAGGGYGGGEGQFLIFGANGIGTTGTPRYLVPGYTSGLAPNNAQEIHLPTRRTFRKITWRMGTAGAPGNATLTVVFRLNGIDTGLTATFAVTSNDGEAIVAPVTLPAGGRVTCRVDKSGAIVNSPVDLYLGLG